jgi:hypothetical protein
MLSNNLKTIGYFVALSLVFGACSPKTSQKNPAVKSPSNETAKPAVNIAGKVKNCKKFEGLFNFYLDTTSGEAYFEVNKKQIGKEFIYFSYSENGVVQAGHNRGSYRDNEVFTLEKSYKRIEFIKQNTEFYFNPESPLSKSKDANISPAVLLSEEIIAQNGDSVFLINADKIFMTEKLSMIKPVIPQLPGMFNLRFSLGNLSKEKSKYQKINNYPLNTEIVVHYVFDNPAPLVGGGSEVTDPRAVSIIYQHSFLQVPDNDFKPRFDDPRVGYFTHRVNDMTSIDAAPYRDVIHRWHLKKKDATAALSEPVEPITWWIENTTPLELRETIMQAGLAWNQAFEKAGFKNAIKMEIQPDTASWDAGDIRYNVLRWTSSPNPPFGGYGPSFVNPRTGQILGADIMLEFTFLTNRLRQEKLFSKASLFLNDETADETANNPHHCVAGELMQHNNLLGLAHLKTSNASEFEVDAFLKSAVYYLVLHEMGHTMGLMHNMKASQLWMPNEIHDKAKTGALGLVGSVMDYPAINFAYDNTKQGDYYTTKPGPYDLWAIEFGYSESLPDEKAEQERLNKLLQRSTERELTFGNDADDMRSPGKGIDPRVMIFDISGDAITYSAERIKILNQVSLELMNKYKKEGSFYQEMVNAFMALTGEIGNCASVMSRYVGGVYVERSVAGQPGSKTAYTPVSLQDQKRALESINRLVFAPDAFKNLEYLYQHLQPQRRGFDFFSNSEDPKIIDRIGNIQNGVMAHLLHPNTLQRMHNSGIYGNKYSVNALFIDLEQGVFGEDKQTDINAYRRNLQAEYTKKLLSIANNNTPFNPYDNLSKAEAWHAVKRLEKMLKENLGRGNETSKAHRIYLLYMIESATKNN